MSDTFNIKEPAFNVIHKVTENVWTFLIKFNFFGVLPLHNRTIIIRIPPRPAADAGGEEKTENKPKGTLVLINPSNPDKSVIDQLKKLESDTDSEVLYLLSPCDWHYMFIGHYLPHFPKAKGYVPPGRIPLQKPKYEYTLINMDDPLPQLAPDLHVLSFKGMSDKPSRKPCHPRREFVFFHPASKIITSGDCMYYFAKRGITQVLAGEPKGVIGFHYKGWAVVSNADECLASVKKMLEWDFDRYICVHGELGNMLESGAKAHVQKFVDYFSHPPKSYKPAVEIGDKKPEEQKKE